MLELDSRRIAVTTDSFVIDPIFFGNGDIGKLAVCGTVNDLAVSGAVPRYLTLSLVLEEGFPICRPRAGARLRARGRHGGSRGGGRRRHQGRAGGGGGQAVHQHRRRGGVRARGGAGGEQGRPGGRGDRHQLAWQPQRPHPLDPRGPRLRGARAQRLRAAGRPGVERAGGVRPAGALYARHHARGTGDRAQRARRRRGGLDPDRGAPAADPARDRDGGGHVGASTRCTSPTRATSACSSRRRPPRRSSSSYGCTPTAVRRRSSAPRGSPGAAP